MRKLTLGLSVCLSGRLSQRDSRTFYAFPWETVYFIRLKLTGSLIIHFSSRARLLRSSMHTYCISWGGNYTIRFNDIFLPTYLSAHVGKLSIKGMAVQGESLRGSSVNRPQMVTRPRHCSHIVKLSVNLFLPLRFSYRVLFKHGERIRRPCFTP